MKLDIYEDRTGPRRKIRALGRGIAVLQAINRGGSITITEMMTATGIPYPTVCRIVDTLMAEGIIEQEPTRKHYRPTALVQTLSAGYQIENQLVAAARSYIVELTNKFSWPVALSTRVGSSIMIRDSTHSLTPLTLHIYHPGYTMPMLESSSGRAYLAFCSDQERAAIIGRLKTHRYGSQNQRPNWEDLPRMLAYPSKRLCHARPWTI